MAHLNGARIIKTRTLKVREGGCNETAFVVEMSDDSRWYTTKGGHAVLNTYDKIVSGTNLDNLYDNEVFTYYGHTEEYSGINTIEELVRLIKL